MASAPALLLPDRCRVSALTCVDNPLTNVMLQSVGIDVSAGGLLACTSAPLGTNTASEGD